MNESASSWQNTTHDWAAAVDRTHLAAIRADPAAHSPGGTLHLVLEVLAYAADEASAQAVPGRCSIVLRPDGSTEVADDGRGTDTRVDDTGRTVRKPVMATRDLRFFDNPQAQTLPDGHPRRGMSVVAALSDWLVHTNRRAEGSWQQRYEHGLPVTGLTPLSTEQSAAVPWPTGTTVHFRPAEGGDTLAAGELRQLATTWPQLTIEITDLRRPVD